LKKKTPLFSPFGENTKIGSFGSGFVDKQKTGDNLNFGSIELKDEILSKLRNCKKDEFTNRDKTSKCYIETKDLIILEEKNLMRDDDSGWTYYDKVVEAYYSRKL